MMIVRLSVLVVAATILSSSSLVLAISAADIPSDIPISSLLATASAHLAKGETNDALTYYDVAIFRDPQNYLTHFKRGATYLSSGRTEQANRDFDKVLEMKPGFEGALQQRAKIKARSGDWNAARTDYIAHGNSADDLTELEEALGAASLAAAAEKSGDWEECITQSGAAIMVASKMLSLRKTRAHCRFERGEILEGMSDLKHILQMQPGQTEPHLQISATTFYGLADSDRGMEQLRKCLHSDPDSKSCKKLYRREKTIDKQLKQVEKFFERKQYSSAIKILLPSGEDAGLVQDIKDDVKDLREAGTISKHTPNGLIGQLVERVCEAYHESKNPKSTQWCNEALATNEHSLYGLLSQARAHMKAESFEAAISTLNKAKEHHPEAPQIDQLLQNAQLELRRSKTKDYYKVLGLPRDADELQIKAAYRKMVKQHHPDKAHKQGISKEVAEKKMGTINEAYEVLSDPELKTRYDHGDDPNDQQQQQHHNPFQGGQFQFAGGNAFRGGSPFGGGQQFNFKFGGGF